MTSAPAMPPRATGIGPQQTLTQMHNLVRSFVLAALAMKTQTFTTVNLLGQPSKVSSRFCSFQNFPMLLRDGKGVMSNENKIRFVQRI